MFEWFKGKTANEYLEGAKSDSNVVKFPEPKEFPTMPQVIDPPKNDFDSSNAYYYLGKNKSGNISIMMGTSTLTMSPSAVAEMIERLATMIDDQYEVNVEYINNKDQK